MRGPIAIFIADIIIFLLFSMLYSCAWKKNEAKALIIK